MRALILFYGVLGIWGIWRPTEEENIAKQIETRRVLLLHQIEHLNAKGYIDEWHIAKKYRILIQNLQGDNREYFEAQLNHKASFEVHESTYDLGIEIADLSYQLTTTVNPPISSILRQKAQENRIIAFSVSLKKRIQGEYLSDEILAARIVEEPNFELGPPAYSPFRTRTS